MKKTIIILTAITFFFACNDSKEVSKIQEPTPKAGIYFSVFKKDGQVKDGAVRVFVDDKVITDSVTGKKSISTITAYGILANLPTKTKEGKDTTVMGWSEIKKDSVKIINNITIDSLFKSFQ